MEYFDRFLQQNSHLHIEINIPLAKYTTLRVGGPADYFAEIENEGDLQSLLFAAREAELPVLIMGNGSNLLVRDGGFQGLVIRLGKSFSRIDRTGDFLYAQAGALLSALSVRARDEGLAGLEFAQGIPGTVGGGTYMNAGAYGGELGNCIREAKVLSGSEIKTVPGEQMDFSYRHSRAMEEGWVVLGALFSLRPGDPKEIDSAMRDFSARRKEKQPLEYPSAGSFFKRPQGHFAGALIEGANLKGLTVGGAQVSEKHAGFLINIGNATAKDFLDLMAKVQSAVMERYQVALEPEVRIVGRDL